MELKVALAARAAPVEAALRESHAQLEFVIEPLSL